MSYILGALKKAEKDRRRDRSLGFDDWEQEKWDNPTSENTGNALLLKLVIAILLLMFVLVAWLAYQVMRSPGSLETGSSEQQTVEYEPVIAVMPQNNEPDEIDATVADVVPVYIKDQSPQSTPLSVESETFSMTTEVAEIPDFSGHIYFADNSSLSRVFHGSESFREGDIVEGYLVEKILETEAILSREGVIYRQSLTE